MRTTSPARSSLEWRVRSWLTSLVQVGLATKTQGVYSLSRVGSRTASAPIKKAQPRKRRGTVTRSRTRVIDVARRTAIEEAAIRMVTEHYTLRGFNVTTREADNCGWDLDVFDPLLSKPILVEVKGASARQFRVEVSSNEFKHMRKHKPRYRVCIVTDALGSKALHEFVYDVRAKHWVDADTTQVLQIKRITAARLTVLP